MDVSENSGTPKSSILVGVFHYKPSILGYPYFWKHPYVFPCLFFPKRAPKSGILCFRLFCLPGKPFVIVTSTILWKKKGVAGPWRLILGGGFNPSEKYLSNWKSFPTRGENKKCLKPPPSISQNHGTGTWSHCSRKETLGETTFYSISTGSHVLLVLSKWSLSPLPL